MGIGAGPSTNMSVCDDNHSQIVFSGGICPICEMKTELESYKSYVNRDKNAKARYLRFELGLSFDDVEQLTRKTNVS